MYFYRIASGPLAAKFPPVKQIGAASRADDRLQLELLHRGFPEIDPIIICFLVSSPPAVV